MGLGVFVLMQVLTPLMAFKLWEYTYYDQNQLLTDPSPYQGNEALSKVLGVAVENVNNFPAIISKRNLPPPPYNDFKLTIPKIGINQVKVVVNSNDFDLNLAHLPGSPLPGEKGNVFITGHSSISSPIQSERDKAFFVSLHNIKKGDEVVAEVFSQKIIYEVVGVKIVDPKDLSVINPPDELGRYMSLMTCVPPGFNTKRLVVLAKLKL